MLVPCGKCEACLRRRQNAWSIRMQMEAKYNDGFNLFLTLTQDDEYIEYNELGVPTLSKLTVQYFLNNLRRSTGLKLRYFACGEYGETFGRPHYHLILFNVPLKSVFSLSDFRITCEKIWKRGFITVSPFTPARATYVAKYTLKSRDKEYKDLGIQPPFALMSRKPGIGSRFLDDEIAIKDIVRNGNFVIYSESGTPYLLPRFYQDKLYNTKLPDFEDLPDENGNRVVIHEGPKIKSQVLKTRYKRFEDTNFMNDIKHIYKGDYKQYKLQFQRELDNYERIMRKRSEEQSINKL